MVTKRFKDVRPKTLSGVLLNFPKRLDLLPAVAHQFLCTISKMFVQTRKLTEGLRWTFCKRQYSLVAREVILIKCFIAGDFTIISVKPLEKQA